MIPELGLYALIMALSLGATTAVLPLMGSFLNKEGWQLAARPLAYGQFLFIAFSFGILMYCFYVNDFSVAYVAQNSNTHLPTLYRLCATWGAHEGSLLLWVLILSCWTMLVARFSRKLPLEIQARVIAILALISVGFLLFLLLTSNPFQRVLPDVPLQGRDLNPLLQDPGLAIHPPILYTGYVGFAVAFAFAITALLSGKFDAAWANWARPWTLVAWSFLTFGITLGSWWAYRVLGWGGWWFWDPVENASFLPWLSGTALIHSLLVVAKRETFKAWTILLAVSTFSLSLMGTFLVRSGVLVSVHAFAVDPARGAYMLAFLAVVIGGSLLLYAWRGNKLVNSGVFEFWSRETLLLTNNVLLTTCMLTVLLGTLYPLIIDAFGLGKLSVGPPYFNSVFIPLIIPTLFLMAIAPAIKWQKGGVMLVVQRFRYTLLGAMSLALLLPYVVVGHLQFTVVIGLLLAFWVILATLQTNVVRHQAQSRRGLQRLGMMLAHIGFAVSAIGITLTTAYSVERDVRMTIHDSLAIGPYRITLLAIDNLKGPNYHSYRGKFLVSQHGHESLLQPELRVYDAQNMATAKTAIKIKPTSDLYIAMGQSLGQDAWSLRVYHKPFVRFIWLGGVMMLSGGLLAAFQTRRFKRNG